MTTRACDGGLKINPRSWHVRGAEHRILDSTGRPVAVVEPDGHADENGCQGWQWSVAEPNTGCVACGTANTQQFACEMAAEVLEAILREYAPGAITDLHPGYERARQ